MSVIHASAASAPAFGVCRGINHVFVKNMFLVCIYLDVPIDWSRQCLKNEEQIGFYCGQRREGMQRIVE